MILYCCLYISQLGSPFLNPSFPLYFLPLSHTHTPSLSHLTPLSYVLTSITQIKVGKCEHPKKPWSGYPLKVNTCNDVCFQNARTNDELLLDLSKAVSNKLDRTFSLDTAMSKMFFDVKKNEQSQFTADILDSVYLSTKLAYFTPLYKPRLTVESWPVWLDWKSHVRGKCFLLLSSLSHLLVRVFWLLFCFLINI